MSALSYNIAAVERDTGLSKDVLRMWERRYGFPTPERDGNGDRLYSAEQVERLSNTLAELPFEQREVTAEFPRQALHQRLHVAWRQIFTVDVFGR